MNATNFNESLKLNKPSDIDPYYSLGNSYTSASFDGLRARYMLARQHYYETLKMISEEMKSEANVFAEKRATLRRECKWIYSIEQKKKDEVIYYNITAKPEYIVQGDEGWYEAHKYQQFFIVNNVVITSGGGYVFEHVKSGDILTDIEVYSLTIGNIPERFTKQGK